MIDVLQNIDTQVFLALNSLRCEALDGFVRGFSGQWIWVPMYAVIAWMMLWRYGWRAGLWLVVATAIAVGCSDFVCASVIRPFVQRLRPANPDNPLSEMVNIVGDYRGGRYGFPSCHAANTFALAVATSLLMKERLYTVFIFAWAILQCYSRIYLGVHYPGDLLAGALVGSVSGFLTFWVLKRTLNAVPVRHASVRPLAVVATVLIAVLILF